MKNEETSAMDAATAPLDVSVVIPVYNSERILPDLHARLSAVLDEIAHSYEIIFVEDCGPDDSWLVLRDLAKNNENVRALQLARNSGQGAATMCGMSQSRGELIVTMDDDLQHPPEEIPRLIEAMVCSPDVDVVMAVPRHKAHATGRRIGSAWMHRVNSSLLGKPHDLRMTGFRALRRNVVDGLLTSTVSYPALGPLILQVTRRIVNLETEHAPRAEGRSNYTPSRLAKQMMSNLIGYSMLPLRILALAGALGASVSVIFAVSLLVRYMTLGVGVEGWMSVMLLVTAMFGFVFFAFGITGEYLLRIVQSVNGTPPFHIRQEVVSKGSDNLKWD